MSLDDVPARQKSESEWHKAVCPHDCPSVCALDVERVAPDRIGKVRGSKRNGYTAGVVCAKVARYAERVHHPDRLAQPLRRIGARGTGRDAFAPISWDDALDEIAEGLLKAEQRYGAEAVFPYFYAGTMGRVQRDGIHRLRHAKGYTRQYDTICVNIAEAGWNVGVGARYGVDALEVLESDVIVVWGGNPVNTQVNFMTHVARARKSRGAKLVVVDPYRTGTAEQADMHLMLKPGTDGALAAATIHILLRDGLADRDFLSRLTDWDSGVEAHFRDATPGWAAALTGLPVAEIEAFAALYGGTKRSFMRPGYGFTRSRNGAAAMHAVTCLPSVTGAWAHKGGGALWGHGAIYQLDQTMVKGLDRLDMSVRAIDQSRLGAALTGDDTELQGGPPIAALFVQNTNPAVVCPESDKVRAGLMRDDLFVAVHEQFMTETAAMADIVLPATTFLEHDDFYTASAHSNLQISRAVIEPYAECRSNHDVHCALASRLGAQHPGFEVSAWELIEETFRASGYGDANRIWEEKGGVLDCGQTFEQQHFANGFPHKDGRFHFRADWSGIGPEHVGMPELPGHWDVIDTSDAERPFRLVAAPARNFLNTSFTETPTSKAKEGKPTALMHPKACADIGVVEGDRIRLGNQRGSVVVHVRPFDGVQKDVVIVESLHPNAAFEEGYGINLLISAEAAKPRGGAVFHDTAIWVRPVN